MTHFIVTFRIKSAETYSSRYASFVSRVAFVGGGSAAIWEETSSFFALQATNTAAGLCNDLYLNSEFDSSKDEMLVIDLDLREKATKGPIKYPNTLETCLGF